MLEEIIRKEENGKPGSETFWCFGLFTRNHSFSLNQKRMVELPNGLVAKDLTLSLPWRGSSGLGTSACHSHGQKIT